MLPFFKFVNFDTEPVTEATQLDDSLDKKKRSVTDKNNSMKKHVNWMLNPANFKWTLAMFNGKDDGVMTVPAPKQKKITRIPKNFDEITFDHVNNFGFVGRVVTFFAEYAVKRYRSEKGLIEYETATGYLSSFKAYFELKFRGQTIGPFQDAMWKRYRAKVRSLEIFFIESNLIYLTFKFVNFMLCRFSR